MVFAGEHAMLEKIRNEKGQWIYFTLKINLTIFQTRFKNKFNGFYRRLSSSGDTLLKQSNFKWFNKSFNHGFYRASIIGSYVEYNMFLRLTDLSKINMTIRQLLIRTKKLGAFNVSINQITDTESINYTDLKLLSSKYGMSAYQKVLKTYGNQ
jgi:hypothetical protein